MTNECVYGANELGEGQKEYMRTTKRKIKFFERGDFRNKRVESGAKRSADPE